jgi:hypothetical protein
VAPGAWNRPPPPPASSRDGAPRRGWRIALGVAGVIALVAGAVGVTLALNEASPPDEVAVPTKVEVEAPEATPVITDDLSPSELAERFGDAVWRVEAEGCDGSSSGTAFAVDDRTLITNWHVTVTDATPTLVSRDGEVELTGRVLGWSEVPDVAVIEVDETLPVTLGWSAASDLAEGDALVALGYPVPATDFTVTPATIMSFQVDDGTRQAIRADGALDKGNSGGPALTTAGDVAGVVTEMAVSDGFQVVPLVYTAEALTATIDDILDERPGVEADCGAAGRRPELPDDWDEWDGPLPGAVDGYGDDPALDALWDACADGDMVACDELYWSTPVGSEYEAFGATCGERSDAWGTCELEAAVAAVPDVPEVPDVSDVVEPAQPDTRGDDGQLDALWDACAAEDWGACDELYLQSPYGSRYEGYGSSCGDRVGESYGSCSYAMAPVVDTYGDDASLDALWDGCSSERWSDCDDLYLEAPIDSGYERYGSTCGDRGPEVFGSCQWERG